MWHRKTSVRNTAPLLVIVLALLFVSCAALLWTYIFYIPSLAPVVPQENLLLDPARNVHRAEDMIINFQPLRDDLRQFENDKNVSLYFEFMNTGANISVNKDADFYPASLLKLPVAMAAVKKTEKGQWKWDNELVLLGADKNEHFGELYRQPIGATFTIRELVRQMLAESDNTAYNIVLRNLEPDELSDINKHLGLDGFLARGEQISAKQYSVILRSLYTAAYLNEENSGELLTIMTHSKFRDYLGSAIPDGVLFSHKIGTSADRLVFLDAGIVYVPNRPYLLTVMVAGKNEEEAKKIMRAVSEKTYHYVVSYGKI